MGLLRFLRRNPIAILALVAVVFVAWVWRDALPTPTWQSNRESSIPPNPDAPVRRKIPMPPGIIPGGPQSPQQTGQALSKLKFGMTRMQVESLVGIPPPAHVLPAIVADGKVTYHIAYNVDLSPVPVQPIRTGLPRPTELDSHSSDRTLVMLEFDATKHGHPLLGIYYPDPLF